MHDPYFAVTVPFDVANAYTQAKAQGIGFFARYLHDCMKAINAVENLKLRLVDDQIVAYDIIHASATFLRTNKTFGCSFIRYDEDLTVFSNHIKLEKQRIENSDDLFPPENGLNCIHCSALPWLNFTGHKEPHSGQPDSVPKLAFGKTETVGKKMIMQVAISVNHALVDGYHVGLFAEKFQENLNS